jgi:hypothetical protein
MATADSFHRSNPNSVVIPPTKDSPPAILIEVAVPADMALNLQRRAGPSVSLGDYLVELATRFGELPTTDFQGVYISGKVRDQLIKIMGRSFQSGEDLLELVVRTKTLHIEGLGQITVPDDVVELIKARSYSEVKDLGAEVRKLIEAAFERYRFGGV